jgi:hypothetical protein
MGMAGYFTMPYADVTDPNLADDLWTIPAGAAPSQQPRRRAAAPLTR